LTSHKTGVIFCFEAVSYGKNLSAEVVIIGLMRFHEFWWARSRFIFHKHAVNLVGRIFPYQEQLEWAIDAFIKNGVIRVHTDVHYSSQEPRKNVCSKWKRELLYTARANANYTTSSSYIYEYIPKSWDRTIAYTTAKNKNDPPHI
jgi:hypothetical protein